MYKKISFFLLMSATVSTAFADVACNPTACAQYTQCGNMQYFIDNGCASCASPAVNARVMNSCNANYNSAVTKSQADAAQQALVTCQVSPPGTPGCQ